MHRHLIPTLFVLALATVATADEEASKPEARTLRILYVGQDPERPRPPFAKMAKKRTYALFRERTAAFEALLRYHFKEVRVVHGANYQVEMSDDVDVTIFDNLPKAITRARREKDPETGQLTYTPPTYLPRSFDRPALMISHNSAWIGESLGLKLDWM